MNKNTEKKLREQHTVFLHWLVNKYGAKIYRTQYAEIAFESGHNVQTICNYFKRLEETGCVTIDVISHCRRTIKIDFETCNAQLAKVGAPLLNVKIEKN